MRSHPLARSLLALGDRALVLASGSPRRRELLGLLGVEFAVVAPNINETPGRAETAAGLVSRLAAEKAVTVAAGNRGAVVIGADTAIEIDGAVLGKPLDDDDARRMLRLLGGRTHTVHTGVAVSIDGGVDTVTSTSAVTFGRLADDAVDWYVATGEPFDKAGGYALQGSGGVFVERVDGSVSGVLGLPLHETVGLIERRLALSGRGC